VMGQARSARPEERRATPFPPPFTCFRKDLQASTSPSASRNARLDIPDERKGKIWIRQYIVDEKENITKTDHNDHIANKLAHIIPFGKNPFY